MRRVSMFALQLRQRLAGAYGLDQEAHGHLGRPLELCIRVQTAGLGGLVWSSWPLDGEIWAAGLSAGQPIEGTVRLEPRVGLRYRFDFTCDSGTLHSFDGVQQLSPGKRTTAFAALGGTINNGEGAPVGRALLRFDLRRDLWPLLRSIGWRRRGPI